MCSGLHPTHTHHRNLAWGEVVFICNLAKREEGGETKHILIAVRTQSKIREL